MTELNTHMQGLASVRPEALRSLLHIRDGGDAIEKQGGAMFNPRLPFMKHVCMNGGANDASGVSELRRGIMPHPSHFVNEDGEVRDALEAIAERVRAQQGDAGMKMGCAERRGA